MRFSNPIAGVLSGLERHPGAWLVGGFVLMAALTGAVVSTGDIVLIALTIGAAAGIALLGLPAATITLIIIGALVVCGPLSFYWPALHRIAWLFATLGLVLAGSALLQAGLARPGARDALPGFVIAAILFILYTLASVLWAEGPVGDTTRGFKRILQYWGLLLAMALIAFPVPTVRRWALLLVAISLLQAPMAVYQRLILVPSLEGQPIDAVVGTLELTQMGTGASGVLALYQVCTVAALFSAWRERLIAVPTLMVTVLLALTPILVGEVNVIFLWLPLALLVVFIDQLRRHFFRFATVAITAVGLMAAFGSVYLLWQQTGSGSGQPLDERIDTLIEYNIGDTGYASKDGLNRKSVWQYWWNRHGADDPKGTLLGHGAGSAFSSDDGRAEVNRRQGGALLDLVALTSVLWDLGVVGLGLFGAVFAGAAVRAHRLVAIAAPGPDRAMARACLAAIAIIASSLFYNNAVVLIPSQQVLTFVTLGLVAWLDRRYRSTARSPANRTS